VEFAFYCGVRRGGRSRRAIGGLVSSSVCVLVCRSAQSSRKKHRSNLNLKYLILSLALSHSNLCGLLILISSISHSRTRVTSLRNMATKQSARRGRGRGGAANSTSKAPARAITSLSATTSRTNGTSAASSSANNHHHDDDGMDAAPPTPPPPTTTTTATTTTTSATSATSAHVRREFTPALPPMLPLPPGVEPHECLTCCEPISVYAVGHCNHRTVCALCVLRLRKLYNDRKCCLCKVSLSLDLPRLEQLEQALLTRDIRIGFYVVGAREGGVHAGAHQGL